MTYRRVCAMLVAPALVATLSAGLVSATGVAAAEPESPGARAQTFSVAPAEPGYWTPDRMKAAEPAPIPARRPGATAGPSVGQPGGPHRFVTPPAVAEAQRWEQGGAVTRTVGRVFFSFDSSDAACSASVVHAANRDTVLTAAHCVSPEVNQSAKNWTFVPGYDDGAAPYGKWSAERLIVPPGWADRPGGNLNEDVGFAVMRPRNGRHLADVVGSNPIEFNTPTGGNVHAFGYPAQGPFEGESLYFCQGQTRPDTFEVGSTGIGLPCDMTGGSSGGPWLAGPGPGVGGTVVSLNSFGYDALPGVMLGPRFDDSIKAVYETVQAATPTGPDPRV